MRTFAPTEHSSACGRADRIMRALLSIVALTIVCAGPALALARADEPKLGPQTALVRAACRDVARLASDQRAALTVYCPPLVPYAPGIRREYAGSIGGGEEIAPGYGISFASRSRFGPRWGGHWTLDVGRPATVRRLRQPFPQHPEELIRIRNRDVGVYRIAQELRSFYAGHVVYAWQERGLRFHLTIHGFDWESQLREMTAALMAAIDRCSAAPAAPTCTKALLRPRG